MCLPNFFNESSKFEVATSTLEGIDSESMVSEEGMAHKLEEEVFDPT
jgi:hypothetical protein